MPLPVQALAPGVVLDGRYEILHDLGSGGMGTVYAARRLTLGDLVAVKQLHAAVDSPENRSRLLIEARAAAHIRHPNVVKIFDFGNTTAGAPYLVMEHLDGRDLEQLLRYHRRLAVQRALELFAPVCAAVEAGHRRGVIHRDIKPGNVLISASDDGREVVKVLDFGLALFGTETPQVDEEDPELLGTPQYMAPETIRGEPATPATDIYALGVLLYQMVTGELPFSGKTPIQVLTAVTRGQRRPPAEVAPRLPPALFEVIDQAMAADPAARPASPEQLARLAERVLAAPVAPVDLGPTPPPQRPALLTPAPETPGLESFVGRREELARLHQEFQKAACGDGRLVMVVGEPGIGKTRLVERFTEELGAQAVIAWGRFFDDPGGRAPAYETFRAMLAGSPDASSPAPDPASASKEADRHAFDLEGEGDAWRLHASVADAFAALAGSRPLVLVLDDVQWAGRADLELLEHLLQALARRGTLLLATVRRSSPDSDIRRWQQTMARRRASVELELGAFCIDSVERFLSSAFGALHIHPRDLRQLHKTSAGNPYFLIETVRHLLAKGMLADRGGWRCKPLDSLDLPPTITQLIEAHLRELDDDLQQVLQVAAVIGETLRFEVLAAAARVGEDALDRLLEKALGEGLLRDDPLPPGTDYAFASEAVRRVLYDALSPARRRRIHRQVVEALHHLHGDALPPLAATLAYHFAAIARWPEALDWSLAAAEQALGRFDSDAAEQALELAHRAAEGLGTSMSTEDRVRLDLAAGVLERRLGHLQSAKTKLLRAQELEAGGERGGEILLELARCRLALGELENALESAREVTAHARDDRPLLLRAGMCEAIALQRLGRAPGAIARLDTLLALAGDDAPLSLRSRILRERAWADLKRGAFADAESQAQRSFELARMAGDLHAQHHALSALAAIRSETGDLESSLPFDHRALELARRLSLRRREGIDLANLGETHFKLERLDQALDYFKAALAIFVEIGDRACQGDCRVNLGRTQLARGEVEQALETLTAARRLCEATGRTEYAGIARIHEGEAHLARGRLEQAHAAYREARDLFEAQSSYLLWQAELGLARVASRAGDPDTARRLASRAGSQLDAQRTDIGAGTSTVHLDRAAASVAALLAELDISS